jgi:drug/metabolite transporter (DMT)-like permease
MRKWAATVRVRPNSSIERTSAGLAHGGRALAVFFANLTPLFAALMSAAVLHEAPQWFHALALALIVAGIEVSSRSR